MGRTTYYTERFAAIVLGLLAVISPLYIDRRRTSIRADADGEDDDLGGGSWSLWLPLLLIIFVFVISPMDRRFTRFDPYWIHRVGGSSCGIMALLFVLGFVLKLKSSF